MDEEGFRFKTGITEGPTRQHLVPDFYQRLFSRNGQHLWLYDRNLKTFRCDNPKNIAVERHFYCIEQDDGSRLFDIENMFSTLEGWAKPVIEKLDRGENPTPEDRDQFSAFLGAAFGRSPAQIKSIDHSLGEMMKFMTKANFSDVERVKHFMKKMEAEHGLPSTVTAEQLIDFVHKGQYDIEMDNNYLLSSMLQQMPIAAQIVMEMQWMVLHIKSDDYSFCTSDSPFIMTRPAGMPSIYGVGLATPGARKIFPLTRKSCLMILDEGEKCFHVPASRDVVRDINQRIALNSYRFLLGPDESLLKNIVRRTKLDQREWVSKIKVG